MHISMEQSTQMTVKEWFWSEEHIISPNNIKFTLKNDPSESVKLQYETYNEKKQRNRKQTVFLRGSRFVTEVEKHRYTKIKKKRTLSLLYFVYSFSAPANNLHFYTFILFASENAFHAQVLGKLPEPLE